MRSTDRSPRPRPRFVYFVQNHRPPPQVARLVTTIKRLSPEAHVLVGHDGRNCELSRRDLPELPGVDLFTVQGPVERGELSLLAPYFQAIEKLTRDGVEYEWLVYLSGQDYPTQPLASLEQRLEGSERDGFFRFWEAFREDNPWGRKRQGRIRYGFRYVRPSARLAPLLAPLKLLNGVQSLVHVQSTYGPHVGTRRFRSPFSLRFVCYAGTQWTMLRRSVVEYLAETVRARPDLLAYYARTICSDESLVQTILVNAGRFRLENDSLRFVDMAGTRDGSPRTLTVADLPHLISGEHHIARKFDPAVDGEVLDRLDDYLFAAADPRKRQLST